MNIQSFTKCKFKPNVTWNASPLYILLTSSLSQKCQIQEHNVSKKTIQAGTDKTSLLLLRPVVTGAFVPSLRAAGSLGFQAIIRKSHSGTRFIAREQFLDSTHPPFPQLLTL